MDDELAELIGAAASTAWADEPSRQLVDAIEKRIVVPLPLWLKVALGRDEASQLARAIAWEKCLDLAANPPEAGLSWGYLANLVRWRLIDAVRAEGLRSQRHPIMHPLPDLATPEVPVLGEHLELIVTELQRHGLTARIGRHLIRTAADGPPFYRAGMIARLRRSGVSQSQAEGLTWLLRGGAGNPSALARLAAGHSPSEVFTDPNVATWVKAAAGRERLFFGGRTSWSPLRELARSA